MDRKIAEDIIDGFMVSTVRLPDILVWTDRTPYETMVFRVNENGVIDFTDLYCDRYSSETEARVGHGLTIVLAECGHFK
jgi:hypothetical protein